MKNLVRRYQLPVSGWEWWYLNDDRMYGEDCYWDWEEEDLVYKHSPNRYMDNPVNNLPYWQSMNFDEWNNHYRKHYRRNEAYVRATAIIRQSAGLHASELFRKVKDCLKYRRTRESVRELINDYLDKTEIEDDIRYFKNKYGNYESRRPYYRRGGTYIFENEEGFIEETPKEKVKGTPRDWRGYYERKRWRRKSDKESKRDWSRMGIFYLKVINHPRLMEYFHKIRDEYRSLNEMEKNSHNERPSRQNGKGNNSWYSWEIYKWRQAKKAFTLEKRRRRDKIRQDLDSMVEGDFSSYYKTRQYLYSLYKECHHF